MNFQYHSLPFALDKIMQQKELPKCSLQQSVAQHLHLIATTAFGELPADENFGCSIWDLDFGNLSSVNKTKESIKHSLLLSIQLYEKRLGNVRVDLLMGQEEPAVKAAGHCIKKVIHITVAGVLKSTNEAFRYHDRFYTGPLSYKLI